MSMHSTITRSASSLKSWRRDEKQRQRTRSLLRRSIHPEVVVAESALASLPDRDVALLHAGSVKNVRRVVNAARRRVYVEASVGTGASKGTPRAVQRPTWILRERRRPALIPVLVEAEPPAKSQAPMTTIIDELGAHLRVGVHRYWALDWLHSTTGLDWPHCSEILRNLGAPVDEGAIAMIKNARTFWDRLEEFRRIHTNAIRLGEIDPAVGTWAYVEASELPGWLSGLDVPLMHRRKSYLVRVTPCGRPFLELDFHGFPSFRALFRVPL